MSEVRALETAGDTNSLETLTNSLETLTNSPRNAQVLARRRKRQSQSLYDRRLDQANR